ncbi:hypothetical protein [Anaerosinus massiliensis]|uniref:hypothetical protein n=1 Tax=Massilibacillus massiliensis TaxID=1806837 RepID=UPI000DA6153F|nr:hypothetical protein [Massilibacillus massiliensis]
MSDIKLTPEKRRMLEAEILDPTGIKRYLDRKEQENKSKEKRNYYLLILGTFFSGIAAVVTVYQALMTR